MSCNSYGGQRTIANGLLTLVFLTTMIHSSRKTLESLPRGSSALVQFDRERKSQSFIFINSALVTTPADKFLAGNQYQIQICDTRLLVAVTATVSLQPLKLLVLGK